MKKFCELNREDRVDYMNQYNIPQECRDYFVDHTIDITGGNYNDYTCDNGEVLDTGEAFITNYLIENNKYVILNTIEHYIINEQSEYLLTGYEFDESEIDKYFNNCPYGKSYKRNEKIEKLLK
jgi:hypothetical protein